MLLLLLIESSKLVRKYDLKEGDVRGRGGRRVVINVVVKSFCENSEIMLRRVVIILRRNNISK